VLKFSRIMRPKRSIKAGSDRDLRSRMLFSAFWGSPRRVTLRLEGSEPIPEHVVEVRQPVLNQTV
jgi:hypothetical protein